MNFMNILCFVSKGSLNIPEYRCSLIGRAQNLYTIEHAVENIAYLAENRSYLWLHPSSPITNLHTTFSEIVDFSVADNQTNKTVLF